MQKRFFATEFFGILLFFVLPPIFQSRTPPVTTPVTFPWTIFALSALAAVLLWQIRKQPPLSRAHASVPKASKEQKRLTFLLNQGHCLLTFGLLLASAGLLELAGRFVFHAENAPRMVPPQTLSGWTNVIAGTVCAAFYEEVLYRAYLPDAIKLVFASKKADDATSQTVSFGHDAAGITTKKTVAYEAVAVILFALAHRYAGWLAVLNALVAGAVLRRCYRKTHALWTNVAAHTAYNALMLAVSFAP